MFSIYYLVHAWPTMAAHAPCARRPFARPLALLPPIARHPPIAQDVGCQRSHRSLIADESAALCKGAATAAVDAAMHGDSGPARAPPKKGSMHGAAGMRRLSSSWVLDSNASNLGLSTAGSVGSLLYQHCALRLVVNQLHDAPAAQLAAIGRRFRRWCGSAAFEDRHLCLRARPMPITHGGLGRPWVQRRPAHLVARTAPDAVEGHRTAFYR